MFHELYVFPHNMEMNHGLMLRDFFAAVALHANRLCGSGEMSMYSAEELAANAYELADAMIKAREDR